MILNKIESLPHEEIDFTRDDFGVNLYANSTFNRVSIENKQNYTLELSNDLAALLGSDELQITESKNFKSIPNIENVLRIKVNCDLISDKTQQEIIICCIVSRLRVRLVALNHLKLTFQYGRCAELQRAM